MKSKKKKKKKKKKKSSSGSYSESTESDSSSDGLKPPLQKRAERKPGSVLKMLMDHVRLSLSDYSLGDSTVDVASSAVNTAAKVQSYFQIMVRPQLSGRPRDEKELYALSLALDLLREGKVTKVADLLAGRYLAVETAALEGSWETAQVARLEDRGATPAQVLLAARKHQRTIDRASGRGSYGQGSWGAGHYGGGQYQDTGGGFGKGRGKKGKDKKGKGKKGKKKVWRKQLVGRSPESERWGQKQRRCEQVMVLEPPTGVAQCTVAGSCEGGGKPACEALAEDWAVQIIHDAFRSVESGEAGHSRGTMVKTGSDEAAVTNEGAEAVASPLGLLKDCSLAESAVDPVSLSLSESDWMGALLASSSPAQLGARLAWGISRGYKFQGLHRVSSYAKPFASNEATPSFRGLFPLPVSFEAMSHWAWPLGDFSPEQCRSAWLQLIAAALNDLYGMSPPYPSHRR